MDEYTAKIALNEAIGSTLATDEGQQFLEAQERQMKVLVSKCSIRFLVDRAGFSSPFFYHLKSHRCSRHYSPSSSHRQPM